MISQLKKYWAEYPYQSILIIAMLIRMIAAIFSQGFGMHDDHFIFIEIPQDWVNGSNEWFQEGQQTHRNLLYPGFHYFIFYFFDNILGITDPQTKMLIIRIIHALYSVLLVSLGYRITQMISTKDNARQVGLILALFWPLPFLSVRTLIEVVCIPPLLACFYYLLKYQHTEQSAKYLVYAGLWAALAMTIRFQLAMFIGGIGLVFIFSKNWKETAWFSAAFFISILLTIGLVDYIGWGKPFFTLINYTRHNLAHRYDYVVGPWYNYLLLLLGVFIIPVGFFLMTGFLRSGKKYAILFWPTLLFLVAHSYFPNKQERFILPMIPFFIILGIIGWNEFVLKSNFWQNHKKALAICWGWFWVVNISLMMIFSVTYMKKNRVEPLSFLSQKDNLTSLIWESHPDDLVFPPKFYLNKDVTYFMYPPAKTVEQLKKEIDNHSGTFPQYMVFLGEIGLSERIKKFETFFDKKLIFEKRIDPPLVDYILHKLNPKNNINQTSQVYRIE